MVRTTFWVQGRRRSVSKVAVPDHRLKFSVACFVSVAILAVVTGAVLGASALVAAGPTEIGQGTYVSESGLAYWSWEETHVGAIPNPVPARVSLVKAAPTLLPPGSTSYTINAAARGQTAIEWTFQEASTTPSRTELELGFTAGLSQMAAAFTVYVESQNVVGGAPVVYHFYWAAPAVPPSSFTIETMQSSVFSCVGIGMCP